MAFEPIIKLTGHRAAVYALADKDAHNFLSFGGEGYVVEWAKSGERNDGKLVASAESPLYCGLFEKSHDLIVTGGLKGILYWVDEVHRKVMGAIHGHNKGIFALHRFSENILSGGGDGKLCWWDMANQSIIHTLPLSQQSLRCIAQSIQGDHIFVGSSDGNIYEVDARKGTLIRVIHAHDMSVFSLFADRDVLFSGGRDALLKAWPSSGDAALFSIVAHMGTINDITLHNDFLVTASRDKNLRIWEKSGKLVQSLSPIFGGHFHSVNAVKSLSESNLLASASDDKSIILWKEK